ncbi:uncharacterized protein zgc:194210 isoform X2 [Triplophysa dalaica]|uniref:uncharacterized protein zgc:194210 isoform X2 n=1 Tax=Triplophysa dalaica TaxID=1582913 RepID=UPI0024DF56AC|nr:uncharacterized protein zgc:194210 isoform X2 [Triplophysa dalaica]
MPRGKCNRASRHYFVTHLPFRTQQVSVGFSGCPLCNIICDSIVQFTSSTQLSGHHRYKTSKAHQCLKRTSPFNMKLFTSIVTVLVFVDAIYSAAMREGSEDLLHFLDDAFQMNLPADHLEPTPITALQTEKILYSTDPTAECKAPEIVTVTEFSNTTPKPNSAENTDSGLTERTSTEDSRDVESFKRSHQKSKLTEAQKTLQEQYTNSEESVSIDTTDLDTEVMKDTNKHPSKVTVMTDISSEEVNKPEENVRYRSLKTIENYSAEVIGTTERQKLDLMKETHPIIQSLAGQTNLKDKSGQLHETDKKQLKTYSREVDFDSPEIVYTPDRQINDAVSEEQLGGRVARRTVRIISDRSNIKTTLLSNNQTNRPAEKEELNPSLTKANLTSVDNSTVDNSTEISGLNPCPEISVGSPTEEENKSLDPSKEEHKIQKDTMSYQIQLRKMCPGKKSKNIEKPKEQLDFEGPERVSHA